MEAWAAGKVHQFNIKVIKNIRWRKAGRKDLQLIVIRPLGYRLTKKSRMLYRQPAYLICTDANLNIEELLQAYLWRWPIEVNFRDEKTLLGCGQAQVRKKIPVEKLPAFIVAVYAMLLLAAYKTQQHGKQPELPRAKWYPGRSVNHQTTGDMLNQFRSLMWVKHAHTNFSHFVDSQQLLKSGKKLVNPILSAALYMRN